MAEFVELLLNGQEVELHYRSKKVTLSGKKTPTKPKTNLKETVARLGNRNANIKFQQAKDFKEIITNFC